MKTWALQFDHCQSCLTTDRPHHAKGLCAACYHKQYDRKNPPKRKDNLQAFINDLPSLLREVGAIGYSASYNHGTVTLKKLGSKLSTTWTAGA